MVVINETLASRLFPGRDLAAVIGQPVRLGGTTGATNEVVGVVANIRSRRPDAVPDPEVYLAFSQFPSPVLNYVVRAEGDPAALTGQIRSALAQMTPNVALAAVRTLEEVVCDGHEDVGPAVVVERAVWRAGGGARDSRYLQRDVVHRGAA